MNTHADKTKENKSQSVANAFSQKSSGESTFQFVDNRPEAVAQRKLQEMANNSPQAMRMRAFQEMANNSRQAKKAAQLQAMADKYAAQQQQPIQKKNNTGLPNNLKSGIENLSGYSMDDVNVHYNSDKPAQLKAHAYAQGTDIHLAPGQEQHLPHEAWHVVQQKQGRVKPTTQLKGNVNINDDKCLEKEADVMGDRALIHLVKEKANSKLNSSPKITSTDSSEVLQGQWWRAFFKIAPRHNLAKFKVIDSLKPIWRVDKRPPSEILKTGFQAKVLVFPMENITMKDIAKYQQSNADNPGIVSTGDDPTALKNDFVQKIVAKNEQYYLYKVNPKGLIEFPLNENVPLWQRIFYSEQQERMIVAGIGPERIEFVEEVNSSPDSEMPSYRD